MVTGVLATPVMACDLCSIYSATEASGGTGKGFYGGVAEQFTRFGTLQDGGHKIANDGEYINSSVSQVFAGYNFNSRFGVQLNLPVIYRSFGSDTDRGRESGIGDASVIGNFSVYRNHQENLTLDFGLLGGLKLPTGDSSRLGGPDFSAGIGGHDLALGSGSVDGVVGASFYGRWGRAFAMAGVQYAIRTEGSFGHQYANDLTWSGGPGYFVALNEDYTVQVQAVISGEYKGKDTFDGVPDDDSAETIVYAGPQVNFTWSNTLSAQLGVDVPVSRYNTGVQVVPDYRAHAAITFRF